jgi:uncharacterized damage-inducible protein DinB
MNVADVRLLFGYDRWATRKVLAAIAGVDEALWGASGVVGERGLGSILVHQLGAQMRWREGLSRTDLKPRPEAGPLPDPTTLGAWWIAEWSKFDDWLATLTDEFLADVDEGIPVSGMLQHLANHGTQHRSEAALLLTEAGRSPGGLDLIDYLEEIAAAGAPLLDPANT